MGPLGMPEMMFILVLALVLFGPKKLPEIGRTVGKAITEFRRASDELKSTFEREMKNLEKETESVKMIAAQYQYDNFNYDYSSQETPYEGSYGTASLDSGEVTPATISASATEGAESLSDHTPEGAIARGDETETTAMQAGGHAGEVIESASTPVSTTSEHNA
jgi:TatA/E family protein of Tat protein translocase